MDIDQIGTNTPAAIPAPHLALAGSGANVTISWTGEGELEFSYYVNGPWFQAPSQNNPQTASTAAPAPGAGQTFYRVRSY